MSSEKRLESSYREMSIDADREWEAQEWSEALISDVPEIAHSLRPEPL
jgi:hypothetical protein